jgi:thiamine-monophosphate kinase
VIGLIPTARALLRSGAKVGDAIFVTGTLGDARAALDCLTLPPAKLTSAQRYFLQRYYTPTPRLSLAQALRELATAAIDISDGLSADLGHILRHSTVGARIELDALPLSPALRELENARQFALHGGDDYELCFTAPTTHAREIEKLAAQFSVRITQIGTITRESGLLARAGNNEWQPLTAAGYTHF